jgi:hypothetical protein
MENKLKRISGIEYSSSLYLVKKKKEYIADVNGYYKLLGIDPNEKEWGTHEIKDKFRKLIKQNGHETQIIEAYKTLTTSKRIDYDSLTKSLNRLIEEVAKGKKLTPKEIIIESDKKYAYYVDEGFKENYDLAIKWMRIVATFNHRTHNDSTVRVVLSNKFLKIKQKWGEIVYVDVSYEPEIDPLAYFLLKETKENWYLDYCKIIRSWDQ